MSQSPIKITEADFSEIKNLQSKFQEIVFKLGNLQVEKMELDRLVTEFVNKEKKLKEEWVALKKLDEGMRDKLVTTYGEGSLDMGNGTFIPASPPAPTAPK